MRIVNRKVNRRPVLSFISAGEDMNMTTFKKAKIRIQSRLAKEVPKSIMASPGDKLLE